MKRNSLSSFISMFFIACVLTVIYIALTERWTVQSALVGLAISAVALFATQKIFLNGGLLSSFTFGRYYFVYVGYLLLVILTGAFVSLKYIFTKNISINLIAYETKLSDENLKIMLANAITLTPGTVSADVKGDIIEVMKLCKNPDSDQTAGFAKMEKVLKLLDKGKAL